MNVSYTRCAAALLMIVVAMVSASSAGAEILPYSSTLTWADYQWTGQLSPILITPFDPSLGILNSVTMSAEVYVEGSASIWASYTPPPYGTDSILDFWARFDEVPEMGWGTTEARFSDGNGAVTQYSFYYRKDFGHFAWQPPGSAVGYAGPTTISGSFGRFQGTQEFDLDPNTGLSISNTTDYQVMGVQTSGSMQVNYQYDYTPRIDIFNVNVSVGHDKAVVRWETTAPASGLVRYGPTAAYGSTASSFGGTRHTAVLDVLPNSTYHYSIEVCFDSAPASTGDATFSTSELSPPTISNVIGIATGLNTATITWTTSVPTAGDDVVDVGVASEYGLHIMGWLAVPTTRHAVTLTALLPDTVYHFRVASEDCRTTGDYTFRTRSQMISNVSVQTTGQNTALVAWQTSIPANSVVEYGLTSNYTNSVSSGELTTNHEASISGLWVGTLYHYRVRSTDGIGNTAASNDKTFVTDPIAGPHIALFYYNLVKLVGGKYQVDLGFRNTGSAAYENIMLSSARLGGAPASTSPILPYAVGPLAPAQEKRVTLTFPASAGLSGSPAMLEWYGYNAMPLGSGYATYNAHYRVVLP